MPDLIEFIKKRESETLRPPRALGEHGLRSSVLHKPVQDLWHIFRLIFAITVHYDHPIGYTAMEQPCQTNSNSALMA
jgi:hypothetical protein